MLGLPTIYDSNDQRNRTLRITATVCAAVFILAVVVLQQHVRMMRELTTNEATAALREDETVVRPGIGEMEIQAKLAVKSAALERRYAEPDEEFADQDPPDPGDPDAHSADESEEPVDESVAEVIADIDAIAVSRTERLRAALVAGEMAGAREALRRLDVLRQECGPDSTLSADAAWFELAYRGRHDEITPEARAALIDRHGWYARLALSYNLPDYLGDRTDVVGGAASIWRFLIRFVLVMGVCFMVGMGLAIWGVVKFASGEFASTVPQTADDRLVGPVYLETFALFAAGMTLFMLVAAGGVTVRDPGTAVALLTIGEFITWSLLLVPLWPLVRGVDRSVLLDDLGLGSGLGPVWKEAGWGVVAWMAGMPLLLVVGLLVDSIAAMFGSDDSGAESAGAFPMFDPPLADSWTLVVLGVVGAVIWAPVIEEIIFRGALHRWLRPKLGPAFTIGASSLLFAAVHPYSSAGLISVASGGLLYGVVREWRGSLVAPIVAHCLHNATISISTVALLVMLGD